MRVSHMLLGSSELKLAKSTVSLAWKCLGSIFERKDAVIPCVATSVEVFWKPCIECLANDEQSEDWKHAIKVLRRVCNPVDFPLLVNLPRTHQLLSLAAARLGPLKVTAKIPVIFAEAMHLALMQHDYEPPIFFADDQEEDGDASKPKDWMADILVLALRWIVAYSESTNPDRGSIDALSFMFKVGPFVFIAPLEIFLFYFLLTPK